MDIREFRYQVVMVAPADDFRLNEKEIEAIKPHLHDAFIACLEMGGRVEPSLKALDLIDKVCREYEITPMEFIKLTGPARLFNGLMDLK